MPSRTSTLLCALAAAALCGGCIVSAPPEYDPPERSPIVLDLVRAQPLVTRIIVVPAGERLPEIRFSVPLRSEDPAGERVNWAIHANYGLPQGILLSDDNVPAGTFADDKRNINFALRAEHLGRLNSGCNQLTLVVGHETFWDGELEEPNPETAPLGYAAHAVWYLNMRPEPSQANDLLNCPSPDQVDF